VTAGSAAADYITRHHQGARVLVLGEEGLADPLRRRGACLVEPSAGGPLADVVVVGAADTYDTAAINAGCLAVDAGAPLYTTVDVPWFHGGLGKAVAASAAIAHAVGWVTGVQPQVRGKPSPALAETLIRRLAAAGDEITVVGDATVEVELARQIGAHAVLVLSGATAAADLPALAAGHRPDLAVADVAELYHRLTSCSTCTQQQGART
jgi:NagD protein